MVLGDGQAGVTARADRARQFRAIGHRCRGREAVDAKAEIEQPVVAEMQGVECVQGSRVAARARRRVGAHDGCRDKTIGFIVCPRQPRIVRIRIGQARAVVERGRTDAQRPARRGGIDVRHDVAVLEGLFAGQLKADVEHVLQAARAELAGKVGLIDRRDGVAGTRVHPPPDFAVDDIALAVIGLAEDVVLLRAAVTRGVAQAQAVAEFVAQLDAADIDVRFTEIAIDEAVEIAAVAAVVGAHHAHPGRQAIDPVVIGNAGFGQFVAVEMVVAQGGRGRAVQAKGDRRRETEAAAVDFVTPGNAGIVAEDIHAQRGTFAKAQVGIERGAPERGRAKAEFDAGEILGNWCLAHQVDAAATVRAPAVDRIRSLDHFDLLDVEGFARLCAGIAHTIDKDRPLRIEATQIRAIALRVAAFAGTKGDARDQPQRIDQVGCADIADQGLGHDSDRARRIQQGCRELGRGRLADGIAVNLDAVELARLAGIGKLRCAVGIGSGRGACRDEQAAEGAGEKAARCRVSGADAGRGRHR